MSDNKGIFCKRCFPDEPEEPQVGGLNAAMIKVWVSGDNNLLNLGKGEYPQDTTWELNGQSVTPITLPKFIWRPTMRGSFVTILFKGETCNHYWIKQTYFHKGYVTEQYYELNDDLKLSFNQMWRD